MNNLMFYVLLEINFFLSNASLKIGIRMNIISIILNHTKKCSENLKLDSVTINKSRSKHIHIFLYSTSCTSMSLYQKMRTDISCFDRKYGRTLCLGESLTMFPLWNHVIFGVGSAVMRHSKSSRLPSSSCLIAGFFAKVGAMPSICLQD